MADTSVLDLIFRIRKAGTGDKETKDSLKEIRKQNKEFKKEVGEMAQGAAAGLAVLAGAYAATVAPTLQYAGAVRDLGRNIGATAEESSKLIQAADDVGISVETLGQALKGAITKGTKPTIENIGKLADEYNKLQPGVARSEFLIKNFGKAGLEMGKLLEQGSEGIKAAGEEAEKLGLVLSDTDVKAAREFEIAMDNLGDVVQGLQFSVGNQLIPVLTQAASTLQLLITANQQIATALKEHEQAVLAGSVSYQAYVAEMERVSEISGGVNGNFTGLAERAGILTEAQFTAASAAARLGDEEDKVKDATWGANDALAEAEAKSIGLSQATLDLADNIKRVQDAQAAWGESTANDVQRALEDAEVKGADYNAALAIIDSTLGTSKLQQEQYQKKTAAIVDEFKKTGDIKAFKAGIDELKASYSPAAVEADKVTDSVRNLNAELAAIPPLTVIRIHTEYTTSGTPPPGGGVGSGAARQAGGPVLGGQKIRWRERGEEMFVGAGGGVVMNNNDMRRMIAALEAIAGKGAGLNMTINTAAQPNVGALASQARAIAGAF